MVVLVGKAILLKLGAVDALDEPIAVGLPTVGSVLYNFHVAPVPSVPDTLLNVIVPVVTPLQIAFGLALILVGFVVGVFTVTLAVPGVPLLLLHPLVVDVR